jgi:hypothetical protein
MGLKASEVAERMGITRKGAISYAWAVREEAKRERVGDRE